MALNLYRRWPAAKRMLRDGQDLPGGPGPDLQRTSPSMSSPPSTQPSNAGNPKGKSLRPTRKRLCLLSARCEKQAAQVAKRGRNAFDGVCFVSSGKESSPAGKASANCFGCLPNQCAPAALLRQNQSRAKPVNPIKARAINPAVISPMGAPRKLSGTSAMASLSRAAASATRTAPKPSAAPKP